VRFSPALCACTAKIIGTSLMDIDGTIYFPNNNVQLTGGSGNFGIQVIAHTIDIGSLRTRFAISAVFFQ